jgi:hypothetical protein
LYAPNIQIPVSEAIEYEFTTNDSILGLGFDQVHLKQIDENALYNVRYRYYRDRVIAVATRFCFKDKATALANKYGGEVWNCSHMNGYGYHVVAFRVGCTHPNLKVEWVGMHDRVDSCPDCGYTTSFDTSG